MKKYNYKYLIGVILGILLCGGSVYAAIMYSSNIISYNNATSTLTSNNVQAAIDELADEYENLVCPNGKVCYAKKTTLSLGDYISYMPSSSSYTTDTTKTGYQFAQIINPKELTLWRVLSLNQDGTVDIISEYVSSTEVYFSGQTGYLNLVGYLNVLARQYENSTYTVGSRYFGYSNQTEYITNTTYFTIQAPWTCSTGGSCSPDPDDYEAYGGGDTGYLSDFNLVNEATGICIYAQIAGSQEIGTYYLASRYYKYYTTGRHDHGANFVTNNNQQITSWSTNSVMYGYYNNVWNSAYVYAHLRPIVTLKSTLTYSGIGTKDYPMEIQ